MYQGLNNVSTAGQHIRTNANYEEFCFLVVWTERDTGCSLRKRLTLSEGIDWEREAAVVANEASHDGRMSVARLLS